jgi:hypothetical protein
MAEAKLVLTDALITEALRRDKAAKRQALEAETENNIREPGRNGAGRAQPKNFRPNGAKKRRAAQHEGE